MNEKMDIYSAMNAYCFSRIKKKSSTTLKIFYNSPNKFQFILPAKWTEIGTYLENFHFLFVVVCVFFFFRKICLYHLWGSETLTTWKVKFTEASWICYKIYLPCFYVHSSILSGTWGTETKQQYWQQIALMVKKHKKKCSDPVFTKLLQDFLQSKPQPSQLSNKMRAFLYLCGLEWCSRYMNK